MRFIDAMSQLGEQLTAEEVMDAVREEHGRGSSRWLSEQLGISQRQARRYLSGQVRRPPATRASDIRSQIPTGRRAARRLRDLRTILAPRVPVISKSSGNPDGTRRIGTVAVTAELREALDEAARLLEEGDAAGAEDAFSTGLLNAYGGRGGGVGQYLSIEDYSGMDFD